MVKMENIKREGNYVTFDGYINGDRNQHFTMKVDLTDNSKSVCSMGWNYSTQKAAIKIFSLLVSYDELPKEYTYIWY